MANITNFISILITILLKKKKRIVVNAEFRHYNIIIHMQKFS